MSDFNPNRTADFDTSRPDHGRDGNFPMFNKTMGGFPKPDGIKGKSGFGGRRGTENLGPQVNFTIWFLAALAALFLVLRVYCKFLRHRRLWWDDHVLILSWVSLVVSNIFISLSITLGFGRPLGAFNFKVLPQYLIYVNIAGSVSILAAQLSKTSFAITVLRISSGWQKWVVWWIIISVNLVMGAAVILTWTQCTPIQKTWIPWTPGKCWPKTVFIRYSSVTALYSGIADICLALLPCKIVWKLSMNRREKAGVMIAMSMGMFAGITSCVKTTQLNKIASPSFPDATTSLVILGSAESAICIMAASIPILRALLRDDRPPAQPTQFYQGSPKDVSRGINRRRSTGDLSDVSEAAWLKEMEYDLYRHRPGAGARPASGLSEASEKGALDAEKEGREVLYPPGTVGRAF